MYKLQFNPSVETDSTDANVWYNDKLKNLGDEFQEQVYHCFDSLQNTLKQVLFALTQSELGEFIRNSHTMSIMKSLKTPILY
jgi:hypothetical protein